MSEKPCSICGGGPGVHPIYAGRPDREIGKICDICNGALEKHAEQRPESKEADLEQTEPIAKATGDC